MSEASEWAKAQIKRDAKRKENVAILERVRGIPATPSTPESDADPRNPNIKREPPCEQEGK